MERESACCADPSEKQVIIFSDKDGSRCVEGDGTEGDRSCGSNSNTASSRGNQLQIICDIEDVGAIAGEINTGSRDHGRLLNDDFCRIDNCA